MRRLLAALTSAACLSAAAQAGIIAYDIPSGTAGNQNFGGALGMDFDIHDASGVTVTDIGVFDDGSNGINGPISVAIYDRNTQTIVPGSQTTINGTDGTAMGGHRFVSLAGGLHLPAGFRGSIVAEGYNASELNGNNVNLPTTNGGSAMQFVGTSRWGNAGSFPTGGDAVANQYLAGSFVFDLIPDTPGTANALQVPDGTVGGQAFGGSLGMEFIVTTAIEVTSLGAFDSGADGLTGTITTEIWSRTGDTGGSVLANQTLTGSADPLEGGHRYRDLSTSITLLPGEYTIVAHGFSATDPNGNQGVGDILNTWNNLDGAIDFNTTSRFGTAGAYPDGADAGFARYMAGSFQFNLIPEPGVTALVGFAGLIAFRRRRR